MLHPCCVRALGRSGTGTYDVSLLFPCYQGRALLRFSFIGCCEFAGRTRLTTRHHRLPSKLPWWHRGRLDMPRPALAAVLSVQVREVDPVSVWHPPRVHEGETPRTVEAAMSCRSGCSASPELRRSIMKTTLALGAALALLSAPALAQYGGGAQNAGGPLGSAARSAGVDYGYGGYYGGPYGAYYGSYGAPVAAGIVGGLALGALAARPYYYPRRVYRPYARVYRRW